MTLVTHPSRDEFQECHDRAKQYFGQATRSAALGFLELYRIKREALWLAGFDGAGEPYQTWEQYLAEFVFEVTNISRSKVYGRIRMISRLRTGLGWEMLAISEALQSPAAVQDALNKLAAWERGTGEFKALKPGIEERIALPFAEESPEELLSDVVSNVLALPRGEGRKYVSELAGELQIWGRLELAGGRLFIIIRNDEDGEEYQYSGPVPDAEVLGWLEGRFGQAKQQGGTE